MDGRNKAVPLVDRLRRLPDALVRAAARRAAPVAGRHDARRLHVLNALLPRVAAARPRRVLFVGCRWRTLDCADAFRDVSDYWTIDPDPDAARFGAPGRHLVLPLAGLERRAGPASFDAVLHLGANEGMAGWERLNAGLTSAAEILTGRGVLALGWEMDRTFDPLDLPAVKAFFKPHAGPLGPARTWFDDGHVIDLFDRRTRSDFRGDAGPTPSRT